MELFSLPYTIISTMFFGGWLTAVFSTILVIALIVEIANDKYVSGYVTFFVYALVLAGFTDVNLFAYTWHNPWQVVGYIASYAVIGAIYSVIKYRPWLIGVMKEVSIIKAEFIELNGLTIELTEAIPVELSTAWSNYLRTNMGYLNYSRIRSGFGIGAQKELILNWIAFWPVSAIGLLVAEPIEKFVNWMYDELVEVYRSMYAKIVSKYVNISDLQNLK